MRLREFARSRCLVGACLGMVFSRRGAAGRFRQSRLVFLVPLRFITRSQLRVLLTALFRAGRQAQERAAEAGGYVIETAGEKGFVAPKVNHKKWIDFGTWRFAKWRRPMVLDVSVPCRGGLISFRVCTKSQTDDSDKPRSASEPPGSSRSDVRPTRRTTCAVSAPEFVILLPPRR